MRRLTWAVVWVGKNTTTFLDRFGQWSLDPNEAGLFDTPARARKTIGNVVGTKVVPCWVFE